MYDNRRGKESWRVERGEGGGGWRGEKKVEDGEGRRRWRGRGVRVGVRKRARRIYEGRR